MNNQQLDKKLHQDAARVKKDLSALVEHGTTRVNRYVDSVSQTTGKTQRELIARMEDDVTQLSKEFEKLKGSATATMKNDVRPVWRRYKSTAQKVANKVTGKRTSFFERRAVRFTMLGVMLSLAVVIFLGVVKPINRGLPK